MAEYNTYKLIVLKMADRGIMAEYNTYKLIILKMADRNNRSLTVANDLTSE